MEWVMSIGPEWRPVVLSIGNDDRSGMKYRRFPLVSEIQPSPLLRRPTLVNCCYGKIQNL